MEYVMTVLGTVIICSLCVMLTPEGSQSTGVRLVGGLCVICALISPLSSAIDGVTEYFEDGRLFEGVYEDVYSELDAEKVFRQSLDGATEAQIEDGFGELLRRNFGFERDEAVVYVSVRSDSSLSVSVVLSGIGVLTDPREISDYCMSILGYPCEIVYG